MRFLGTRSNQNFFKLGLVTHENEPMSLFDSRVILEVLSQKQNSRLSVLKRGEHGYERKREKKREKRKERREKGKKRWSKVGDVIFLLLQDLQVITKW